MNNSSDFDIVLVLRRVRNVTYFLNILKALGKTFKIGILDVSFLEPDLVDFKKELLNGFIRDCENFGGKLIENLPVATKVLFVPQEPYSEEAFEYILTQVKALKKVGYMHISWTGLHDDYVTRLGIQKVYIIHQRFFEFLLTQRGDPSVFNGRELVEVGVPYRQHPVFSDFTADYLLAIPTSFSFPHEKDKWDFLETVLTLFEKIPENELIVYKPHNAKDKDYFAPPGKMYYFLSRFLQWLPVSWNRTIFRKTVSLFEGRTRNWLSRVYTSFLYQKVMKRVVPMDRLTFFSNYAMEAFLPCVKRGVIGGLSNTIWGALYFNLPYFNCVDIKKQNRNAPDKLFKKDASPHLETNLKFFEVPFCEGTLQFDQKYFSIVEEKTRKGDLVSVLHDDLKQIR